MYALICGHFYVNIMETDVKNKGDNENCFGKESTIIKTHPIKSNYILQL